MLHFLFSPFSCSPFLASFFKVSLLSLPVLPPTATTTPIWTFYCGNIYILFFSLRLICSEQLFEWQNSCRFLATFNPIFLFMKCFILRRGRRRHRRRLQPIFLFSLCGIWSCRRRCRRRLIAVGKGDGDSNGVSQIIQQNKEKEVETVKFRCRRRCRRRLRWLWSSLS